MAKKRLIDLKTEQHPFNWTRYNTVLDEIAAGIEGMEDRGYAQVAASLQEAQSAVYRTWELIQAIERAEWSEQDAQGSE